MIETMPVPLSDCPVALQAEAQKRLEKPDSVILSVTVTKSTPYKDKSIVFKQYRVIMNRMNLVSVLHCCDDGILKDKVFVNELIWGDILEIIRAAPDGSSLSKLRESVSEQARKLLSL